MTSSTSNRQSPNPPSTDERAIRDLYEQFMSGWNRGSGEAQASPFAEDGDLVGFDGTHLKGRRAIATFHQPLFDKWLKGSQLIGRVDRLRFLSPDVALMHAVGGTIMRGKSRPSPERDSIQTLVAVKENGQWRLAAFQNTRLRPMGRSGRNTGLWLLSDWLWKGLATESSANGGGSHAG